MNQFFPMFTNENVLFYFDGPQVLTFDFNGHTWVAQAFNSDEFLAAKIDKNIHTELVNGRIDLRTVMLNPKDGKWSVLRFDGTITPLFSLTEDHLPGAGVFFT